MPVASLFQRSLTPDDGRVLRGLLLPISPRPCSITDSSLHWTCLRCIAFPKVELARHPWRKRQIGIARFPTTRRDWCEMY